MSLKSKRLFSAVFVSVASFHLFAANLELKQDHLPVYGREYVLKADPKTCFETLDRYISGFYCKITSGINFEKNELPLDKKFQDDIFAWLDWMDENSYPTEDYILEELKRKGLDTFTVRTIVVSK